MRFHAVPHHRTKLIVTIDPRRLEEMCSQHITTRKKRDAAVTYFNKDILHEIVQQYKQRIETVGTSPSVGPSVRKTTASHSNANACAFDSNASAFDTCVVTLQESSQFVVKRRCPERVPA